VEHLAASLDRVPTPAAVLVADHGAPVG
jgi:hypothetical protein